MIADEMITEPAAASAAGPRGRACVRWRRERSCAEEAQRSSREKSR